LLHLIGDAEFEIVGVDGDAERKIFARGGFGLGGVPTAEEKFAEGAVGFVAGEGEFLKVDGREAWLQVSAVG
jgi:hypothetical protein